MLGNARNAKMVEKRKLNASKFFPNNRPSIY